MKQFEVVESHWGRVLCLIDNTIFDRFWGQRRIVKYLDNPAMQAKLRAR